MSLSQRRASRRDRAAARESQRAANEQLGQLALWAFGLLGGIAVTIFTRGSASVGLGAAIAFVCALLFIRDALRIWRESRMIVPPPETRPRTHDEELR